jgi:hypothetical protein
MKKGDRVEIRSDVKYSGQFMEWTESFTGKKKITAGSKLFHFSDVKINAFLDKQTCFFTDLFGRGYAYGVIVKNDIIADSYGDEEVRINLSKYKDDLEIYYIGSVSSKWTTYKQPGEEGYNPNFGVMKKTYSILKDWK